MYGTAKPITPRNGHTLIVGIIARISGCQNQKEVSLDDQIDHTKQLLADLYTGPVEFRIIRTQGKGERLDRPELEEIRQELCKNELDLLLMEDLGRLVRGVEAVRLFGLAVDRGTRAISPNDRVDTDNSTWEEDALAACRDHVAHNSHTSQRLKQKLMNRFQKFGGATSRPIAGYIVPPGAKTFDDWSTDPDATIVIQSGLNLLKHSQNGEDVADYFEGVSYKGGTGFPTGPYCRRERWDGRMVLRFYRNRLLSGRPGRGFRHTIKRHESGRRISVPNPDGPCFRIQPNVAHLDAAKHDEVIALVGTKNGKYKRKGSGDSDPRYRSPRKRTRWPGQCEEGCWYCGHHVVWGGNGMTGNLMCSAAREWRCWNSFGFDGALAARRVTDALMAELDKLDGIDARLRQLMQAAHDAGGGQFDHRRRKLEQDERSVQAEREQVKQALRQFGGQPIVEAAMADLAESERRLAVERQDLDKLARHKLNLPASTAELRELFREEFAKVAAGSPEFGILLRRVVPRFQFFLVRLVDGGHPLPRACVTFALEGLVPDARHVAGLTDLLRRELSLDLFEPPQRERIRLEAVALAAQGLGPKEIARRISEAGKEKPTSTAVQNALKLDARMKALGLSCPYVTLHAPPDDYPKLRRHKNPKYHFQPREGYVQPPLPEG